MDRKERDVADARTRMRNDWDYRAEINPCYFVKSDKSSWELEEYFQSGERDVHQFLDHAFLERGFKPSGRILLEIGCGNGRMTRSLCAAFGHVYAYDISQRMIDQAKQLLSDRANVTFVVGSGTDLRPFRDEMFDYCFSYTVFQHIPERSIVYTYLGEIFRTLKPGGIVRLQYNGYMLSLLERVPKKYIVRLLGALGIKRKSYSFRGYFDTWVGVYLPKWIMRKKMLGAGFVDIRFEDYGGTDVWVDAIRPLR